MNKLLAATLFGAVFTVLTAGVQANELPTDKKFTIDIASPGIATGSPTVGGRMFLSSDTAIEIAGNLQLLGKDGDTPGGTQLSATGGIMKYMSKGRVSPYMRAGGGIGLYFGDRFTAQDNTLQGYAGVGAEFMITQELSLRASVNGELMISPFVIATKTSELSLSFFF